MADADPSENVGDAVGVIYFELPGMVQKFFRCTRRSATLRPAACAANWEKAQAARHRAGGSAEACRACPVGAAHAGKVVVYRNPLFGTDLCPRCRRGGSRIVGNRLCISCYNRERELRVGRNAKGSVPRKLHLRPCEIGVVVDAGTTAERHMLFGSPAARDERELEIIILRATSGHVKFCPAAEVGDGAVRWRPQQASTLFLFVGEGRDARVRVSSRKKSKA